MMKLCTLSDLPYPDVTQYLIAANSSDLMLSFTHLQKFYLILSVIGNMLKYSPLHAELQPLQF